MTPWGPWIASRACALQKHINRSSPHGAFASCAALVRSCNAQQNPWQRGPWIVDWWVRSGHHLINLGYNRSWTPNRGQKRGSGGLLGPPGGHIQVRLQNSWGAAQTSRSQTLFGPSQEQKPIQDRVHLLGSRRPTFGERPVFAFSQLGASPRPFPWL